MILSSPTLSVLLDQLPERIAQRLHDLERHQATRARLGENHLRRNVFWMEI